MRIIDRGIIYDGKKAAAHLRCAAFSRGIRLHDGTLLCSFNAGPEKVSATDTVIIRRSTDDGATWHTLFDAFPTVHGGKPGSLCSGYMTEPEPGRILAWLLWIDRSDPTLPLANPKTSGLLPVRCLLSESGDGGKSWCAPRHVDLAPCRGATSTDAIIHLDNGSLFAPFENWRDWDDAEGTQRAGAVISTDRGLTWSEPVVVASDPAQRLAYWDNRIAKDPSTGQLVATFWTHDMKAGSDMNIHLSIGESDGRTWSTPHDTGIAGQVTAPLPLGGGRLLCGYVHRHDPPSIRVILSDDMGRTWRTGEELVVFDSSAGTEPGTSGPRLGAEYWEDMYRWTFGHPYPLLLDDSTVFMSFYGGDATSLSIHWVKIGL